jgi:hypothetical protein
MWHLHAYWFQRMRVKLRRDLLEIVRRIERWGHDGDPVHRTGIADAIEGLTSQEYSRILESVSDRAAAVRIAAAAGGIHAGASSEAVDRGKAASVNAGRAGARRLPSDEEELGPDEIKAALERAGGNITLAASALGLPNRYVLYRLMSRVGIATNAPARVRLDAWPDERPIEVGERLPGQISQNRRIQRTNLYDNLQAALHAIDSWLVANPEESPQRVSVYAARQQFSRTMDALAVLDLEGSPTS